MNEPRKILLTFDYEPFLGAKSGTVEKCMLRPTDELRAIMNKYEAKAVFFVDTLYLLNLAKHQALNKDFLAVTSQLKELHAEGHYIFPHIHPHWIDATYLEDKKEFSLTNTSLYSLANLQGPAINALFEDSFKCLNDIGITYPQWGYRAGGWCIQPFNALKNIFISKNIVFDFSVLPGCRNDSPNQAFNFSRVTKSKAYYFSDAVEVPDDDGQFVEFPISTIQFSPLTRFKDRLVRKYLWKKGDKGYGDGMGAQLTPVKFNLVTQEMIAIELLNAAKLNGYKRYLKNEEYMHWISHPKMVTEHGLRMFDNFLDFATNNYAVIFDFHKMIPFLKNRGI